MNLLLTEQIIRHVFYNFGIIKDMSNYSNHAQSLITNDFILNEKLSFEMEDNSISHNNIWGCQFSIENQEIKIILGDTSQFRHMKEYCLIIHPKNYPMYGLYLSPDAVDIQPLIAYTIDNGINWLCCNTYLQATFLAGIEQIKDCLFITQKCVSYETHYKAMLSFIEFHSTIFEDNYEREKS